LSEGPLGFSNLCFFFFEPLIGIVLVVR